MAASRLAAGERVADYVVERLLGQGGMGAVYAARHAASGARHALKVLRPEEARGGEASLRFAREAQALARVDRHPNVVRVHGAGVREDGLAWCALDLVEGGDLEQVVRRGPLPVAEVLRLGEGVARALAHLHAAGVTHRDVKPANVLLAGPERRPVLTDFGIARDALDTRLTHTGQLLGTPGAMSPEQVQGLKELVGPPADVWALGVLLFELLAGEQPWGAASLHALIIAISAAPPPPLRARRPEVPAELEAVVRACLTKERQGRPTAAAVADALGALSRGERPSRSGPGAARRRSARPALLVALAAAALLLAAAVGVGRWQEGRSRERAAALAAAETAAAEAAARSEARAARLARSVARARARFGPDPPGAAEGGAAPGSAEELAEAAADAVAADDPLAARARLEALEALLARPGARDPAGARAAAGLAGPVLGAEALAAAARLDPSELRTALGALRTRDPALAPGAARAASALAAARWAAEPERSPAREAALRAVEAAAEVGPPAPRAAGPLLELLGRAVRASDWRATARAAERARLADPGVTLPPEASGVLHAEVTHLFADGEEDEAVDVLCAAQRAGIELVLESRTLEGLDARGALDRAIERRPDDWAARLWRCRAGGAQWTGLLGLSPARAVRLHADARAVLTLPGAPPAARGEARVQEVAGLVVIDPAGHAARCERLWRDPGFPDRRRLAWLALRGALAIGRPDLGAPWGPRLVAAIDEVARRTASGTLAAGEEPIREPILRQVRAHQLWVQALVDAGRPAEALEAAQAMERRGCWPAESQACQALALLRLGRLDEALALADRASRRDPASGEVEAIRQLCQGAVDEARNRPDPAQGPR